jgi:serine phosphatase RsbU (regulator of sigma subunit)
MLLYTDGLTEAAAPAAWTRQQLHHHLRACAAEDPAVLLTQLGDAAIRGAGGRPRDDMALLAMRSARADS